ncbi:MAG: hypothetical protein GF411_02845 [Candidatus Lokiarchaeota archaeon]|nr:hypothetical protein [Candidatus Lokiarchaeota archaeon]
MTCYTLRELGATPEIKPIIRTAWALWVCYYYLLDTSSPSLPDNGYDILGRSRQLRMRLDNIASEYHIDENTMNSARDTVVDVTKLKEDRLLAWMHQEQWHKIYLPLFQLGRIPRMY